MKAALCSGSKFPSSGELAGSQSECSRSTRLSWEHVQATGLTIQKSLKKAEMFSSAGSSTRSRYFSLSVSFGFAAEV